VAEAHQSPAGCFSNSLDLRIERDRPVVRNGESVTWTIYAKNLGAAACDTTGVAVWLQVPTADGTPSASKVQVTAGTIALASGALERRVGAISTGINGNPGVTDAVVRASTTGVLHDAPADHAAEISKTLGTTVIYPGIEVDKVGSITNGQAPQNVTYTFSVYNRSNPPIPLDNVSVSDSLCPNVTGPAPGGDANGDGRFDPTEVWVYTCTMNHPTAGTYNNTVTACAELILNGVTQKVCDEDTWSVVLTSPPAGGVKPQSVAKSPCTLARANATTVRAGQLNTIRVRVRNVDAGTKVTLTVPGGKKYTVTADKNGLATFRVRPTKSGTASIQAAECSDVERLSVKPARRVVAQRAPRVTG
jgi:uncharacterized repeat protein (TIGR01451 family)